MKTKEQIEDLIENGRHFCIYPWIHLFVSGSGRVGPCCNYGFNNLGNLNIKPLNELWQDKAIRDMRLKMLEDKLDMRCFTCYGKESANGSSLRKQANQCYKKHIGWVANTDDAGYAPDSKPVSWDIRFSNICNLRCRTCSSFSSTGWINDEKAMGYSDEKSTEYRDISIGAEMRNGLNSKRLLNYLEEYIPYVEHIYCAGGEPLLIKENLTLLEKLGMQQKYDFTLEYNTNLTQLDKSDEYISYWKRFKDLSILISLDGSRKRGEYIRKGMVWDNIVTNLNILKKECPHASLTINYTVSAYNILSLPDFHREIVEQGLLRADRINLNILHMPEKLNVKILPPELKETATKKLLEHISWLQQQPPFIENGDNTYFFDQWRACINFMNEESWKYLIPEFVDFTNKLDSIRNERCLDVFPELEPVFSYIRRNNTNKSYRIYTDFVRAIGRMFKEDLYSVQVSRLVSERINYIAALKSTMQLEMLKDHLKEDNNTEFVEVDIKYFKALYIEIAKEYRCFILSVNKEFNTLDSAILNFGIDSKISDALIKAASEKNIKVFDNCSFDLFVAIISAFDLGICNAHNLTMEDFKYIRIANTQKEIARFYNSIRIDPEVVKNIDWQNYSHIQNFSRSYYAFTKVISDVFKSFPDSSGFSIQDAGSNTSQFTLLLSTLTEEELMGLRVRHIIASDLEVSYFRDVIEKYLSQYEHSKSIRFIEQDFTDESKELPDADVIILNDVLEHFQNDEESFRVMERFWNRTNVLLIVHVPQEEKPNPLWGHHVAFNREKLLAWAKRLNNHELLEDKYRFEDGNYFADEGFLILKRAM